MAEDPRCCGSGTCIIDSEGRCWCGQQWDGNKMVPPKTVVAESNRQGPNPPSDEAEEVRP